MEGKNRLTVVGQTTSVEVTSGALSQSFQSGAEKKSVAFVTLGCSKNTVDSEVMMGSLSLKGYSATSNPSDADMIVVNTCAFLESAVEEGIDTILELSEHKKAGTCKKLVVAGCMVERFRSELKETLPEVDAFISTDEIVSLGDVSEESSEENQQKVSALDSERKPYFLYDELTPRVLSTPSHMAYVKVGEGCNRPCTFCIIPKIRGSFRSRSIVSVRSEVEQLVEQGVKEINLIAQDLTSYGSDFSDKRGFSSQLPELIEALDEIQGREFWVRLFYAYPIGTDERLINAIASSRNVAPYLDMPLQHISSNVLKSMRRPLGGKRTRALIEMIRNVQPSIHLRTTFVVGFPGETEEDVDQLEEFIREEHFSHVGIFTYSQEKEAVSYTFPNQVDEDVKDERRSRLMEAQQEVAFSRLEGLVGTTQRVLIEGLHPESDLLWSARTGFQGPEDDGLTIINDFSDEYREGEEPELLQGTFQDVKITEAAGYDLVATLV